MRSKRSGQLIAVVLAMCMILGSGPMAILAQAGSDIEGHWAEQVINRWVDRKIVDGYPNGTFRPSALIKRAEFAALINRTFGFATLSAVEFSDVSGDQWFATDVSKAVGAGYMDGYPDGTFKPNANISRQEAAIVLARILGFEKTDKTFGFTDIETIPAWSLWAVVAVANAGIMTGYPDGSFGPTGNFTRAETVTVLDRLVAEVFTEEGTYGDVDEQTVIEGNVVVLAENVKLCNYHITGDLLIAESVGEGAVTLDRVIVDGELTVKGGGADSVVIKNSTVVTLIVDKEGVRIVIQDGTRVSEAYVRTPSRVEQDADGKGIEALTIEEIFGEGEVTLSGDFPKVSIRAESGRIVVDGGHIDRIIVESDAADVVVELGSNASVTNLVLDAPVTVEGTGKIEAATVNASGAVIEQQPGEVVLPEGVSANIGGKDVVGSAPVVTPGGSSTPSKVSVSAISVEGEAVVGQELTAKPDKTGATGTYQWMRSTTNDVDGEYENIGNATTNNKYTLVADDAGKYIKVKFTASGNYRGVVTSEPVGPVAEKPHVSMTVSSDVEPFTVDEQQEFVVKTVANDDAGRMVRAHFEIPDQAVVEYQEQQEGHSDFGKWFPLEDVFGPATGFPVMDVDDSAFRATFNAAGDYTITIKFIEVDTDEVLATYEMAVTVNEKPHVSMTVSSDVEPFTVDEQQEFVVKTVANDDAGRMVRAHFEIPDQAVVEYQEQQEGHSDFGKWFPLEDVFGPATGFPVMDVDDSAFRATFNAAGDYTITIKFIEVDTDEVLATYEMAVTVNEKPHVSMTVSSDVEPFTVDEQQEFVVKTVANDDAGRMVRAHFEIPDQAVVEYQEQQEGHSDFGKWFPLEDVFGPATGFPVMDVDDSAFRATFNAAGDYTITIKFIEVDTDEVLATYEMAVTVNEKPHVSMTVSSDVEPFTVDEQQEFVVKTVANDDAGRMVRAHFEIPDQAVVEYQEQQEGHSDFGKWFPLEDVFGPATGFPVMDVDDSAFRATFNAAGDYTITIKFIEVDTDEVLATYEMAVTVNEKPHVSMTVSSDVEPFTVDEQQEFVVKTVANDDAGRMVRAHFEIPDQAVVEYQEQQEGHSDFGKWFPLEDVFGPATGFPVMDVDDSAFRATFNAAGDYTITIKFIEVDTDEVLATYEMAVTVQPSHTATISSAQELKDALLEENVATIKFGDDITLDEQVNITRSVVIDGQGKQLKGITGKRAFHVDAENIDVTIQNINFDTFLQGTTVNTVGTVAIKGNTYTYVERCIDMNGFGFTAENVTISGNTFNLGDGKRAISFAVQADKDDINAILHNNGNYFKNEEKPDNLIRYYSGRSNVYLVNSPINGGEIEFDGKVVVGVENKDESYGSDADILGTIIVTGEIGDEDLETALMDKVRDFVDKITIDNDKAYIESFDGKKSCFYNITRNPVDDGDEGGN